MRPDCWISCAVFALALLWPGQTFAQERGEAAFVAQVMSRNPALKARAYERESFRRRAAAEGLWPDPEVSVMLDRVPERHEGEMPMIRYQLSQMIPWPGKLGLMEEAVERQGDAAAAEVERQALDLRRDARQGYAMLSRNRGLREVNQSAQRLIATVAQTALSRYGAGTGGHHEVVRAEVELNALQVEQVILEGERVSIVAMLNALRDFPVDAPLAEPELPRGAVGRSLPATAELLKLAVARRPELRRMRAMEREEAAMARLARRERYPDLMTSVWYNQMLGGEDTVGVMLGASIPVFGARRYARQASAFDLRARGQSSDASAMRAMIRYEVADAVRRVDASQRALELIVKVARPRAEESFASVLAAYSTGSVDLVAVLEAWRALLELEQARIEGENGSRIALADLERAVGGPVQGGAP